jgi:hypothetical protein
MVPLLECIDGSPWLTFRMPDYVREHCIIGYYAFPVTNPRQEPPKRILRGFLEFDLENASIPKRWQNLFIFGSAKNVIVVNRYFLKVLQEQLTLVFGEAVAFVYN